MNHDWPGPAVVVLAMPAGLGHLCHFILAINLGSGLGVREPVMDRVRTALCVGFFGSSAILLWEHLHHPFWTWSGLPWGYAVLCVVSGTILWPLASLARTVRRQPEGVSHGTAVRELAAGDQRDELIGDSRRSWLLRLPGNESFRLCLREWDVALPSLPEPLDGLQIVQLSDLHMAPCFRRRYFQQVIDACRDWPADLIVLTGDIIENDEAIAWIEPLLGPLEARLGKYAILGNHDEQHQPRAIIAQLGRAGFEMLEGDWTTVGVDGATIALGGTSAPWGPDLDFRAIPRADFRIVLSHSPDQFYRAARSGIDLMLAGHNHGGQIRLPFVGAVFMPSRYSRRFDRGFFQRGPLRMYVSEGVAGMHPIRYGCPPEVARLVLRATPPQPFHRAGSVGTLRDVSSAGVS